MNLTEIENSFWNSKFPWNKDPFHIIMIPPDAPIEGKNSNLLNFLGVNFLIY
jgi:hypothetical protein